MDRHGRKVECSETHQGQDSETIRDTTKDSKASTLQARAEGALRNEADAAES